MCSFPLPSSFVRHRQTVDIASSFLPSSFLIRVPTHLAPSVDHGLDLTRHVFAVLREHLRRHDLEVLPLELLLERLDARRTVLVTVAQVAMCVCFVCVFVVVLRGDGGEGGECYAYFQRRAAKLHRGHRGRIAT